MRQLDGYTRYIILMGSDHYEPDENSTGRRISAALLRGDKLSLKPFTDKPGSPCWLTMKHRRTRT